MKTDEINQLLANKFVRESKRLASWGTKTDEKAAISFAMAVSEFVRAMMADSRYRELKRIKKFIEQDEEKATKSDTKYLRRHVSAYVDERLKATKTMATAIKKFAEDKESKRIFGSKKEKHEHHSHERGKHDHKESSRHKSHDSRRSSKSSKSHDRHNRRHKH